MSQPASLAMRLQENWMNRHPQDTSYSGSNLDDSLTSLGWLQNLRVSEFTHHRQVAGSGVKMASDMNFVKSEFDTEHQTSAKMLTYSGFSTTTDHRANPYTKPPFSYASLICMAMKATKTNKITLASIYNWITDNFVYYRHSDPSWQNSIRHNLSLNKCFQKVARRKDEPGKGGFWTVNPEYCDLLESGVLKKRYGSRDSTPSPPLKRFKVHDGDTCIVYDIRNRAREDTLLSKCISDLDAHDEDNTNSLSLTGDLNWLTILNQDIEIGGKTIKTEDILDECENSPFMSLTPPSSETTSDDLGLDFLSQTDFHINLPVDFQTNDPLDLSVQGTLIRPPDWWSPDDDNNVVHISSSDNNSGLNTPVPTSLESDPEGIIWGEGLKLGTSGNSFDLESLFALDRLSSPKQ